MRYYFLLLFSLILLWDCDNNSIEIDHLNGYWEIKEVIMPDGSKREYTVNNTIDYIELNQDSTGIRKKLKPRLDGTFETSDKLETININPENQELFIHYSTPLMEWKEQIISLKEDDLVLENERSIRYIYKRHQPFEKL